MADRELPPLFQASRDRWVIAALEPDEHENGGRWAVDRLRWLEACADRPAVSAVALALAFALVRHLNRESGDCFPGHRRLGSKIGRKERQVRRLVEVLEAEGLLLSRQGGDGGPTLYVPTHPDLLPGATRPATDDRPALGRPDTVDRSAADSPDACGRADNSDRTLLADQTGQGWQHNPTESEPQKTLPLKAPRRSNEEPPGFERFWAAFPNKDARHAAVRGYAKALSLRATDMELLAGAERYAASRSVRDGYSARAAKWLADRRWQDPPEPERPTRSTPTSNNRPSALAAGIAIAETMSSANDR